jgi:lysyl-tRNA synthetase class 2
MCEWYSLDADYMDSVVMTEELFEYIYNNLSFTPAFDIRPPFIRLSMKQAFRDYLDINLDDLLRDPTKHPLCEKLSIDVSETSTPEEIFNKIFLTHIEPSLPVHTPVILYDYPASIPVLAKKKKSGLYYERWELYISGIEIGNCYSEETDQARVREFIKSEGKKKEAALVIPRIDGEFSTIFDSSYPECSGVALGMDRLFMIITGINSIEGVILFPFSSIMH